MEGSAKTLDKPLLEDDEGVLSFTPPRPDGDEKDNEEALAAPQSSKQLNIVRAAYAVGDFPGSAATAILGFFLLPFLLQVAEVHAFTAAIILMLGRIWDAVTDPAVGRVSDTTFTKWGRRRPWLVGSSIPFAISYFFIWIAIPANEFVKFLYYLFWIVLYSTFYTCLAVPHLALIPDLTDDKQERTILTAMKVTAFVVSAVIGTAGQGLILFAFGDNKQLGYGIAAFVFAVIFVVPPWITFYFTKERKLKSYTQPQMSWKDGIVKVVRNKAFVIIALVFLLVFCAVSMIITNFYLYVQYVLDAEIQVFLLIFVIQISVAISTPLWAMLGRNLNKKMVYYCACAVVGAVVLGMLIVQPGMWYLYYPGAVVAGAGIGAVLLIPLSFLPPIIDADEVETGLRREGVYYGLFIFLQKAATSLALAFGSASLGLMGFDAEQDADETPLRVRITLRILVGLIPAILIGGSAALMFFFKMPAKTIQEKEAEEIEIEMDDLDAQMEAALQKQLNK